MKKGRVDRSFDERLAADQILEILVKLLVLLLLLNSLRYDISELSSVEERACVLQDVLGSVIENLPDEQSGQSHQLWVLTEVQFVLYAQFKLKDKITETVTIMARRLKVEDLYLPFSVRFHSFEQ